MSDSNKSEDENMREDEDDSYVDDDEEEEEEEDSKEEYSSDKEKMSFIRQILETKIEKKCFVYPGTNVTCAFCGTMHALSTVQTHYRVGHKDQCMHLEAWNEYKEQNPFLIVNTSKQGVAPGEKKPRNSKNVQKEHKAKKVGRVNGKFKISTEHSASNKIEQSLSKLTKQMENMHKKVSSMEEQMKKLSKPKSIAPKDKTVPDSPCS